MIQDFNEYVVLTSQDPAAFLNFRWESGDSSISISLNPTSDVSANVLWVNGLDISQEASIYGDPSIATDLFIGSTGDPSIASYHIYTRSLEDFDANLSINYIYVGVIPINLTWSIGSGSWSPLIIFGDDIASAGTSTPGAYLQSNTFSVTGGLNLDGSMNYTQQGAPTMQMAIFLVDETGPSFSNTTGYDPSALGWEGIGYFNFSQYIDPSTTAVKFRWLNPGATLMQFGSDNFVWQQSGPSLINKDVSVLNRPFLIESDFININETTEVQVDGDTSYMLMRTNPKFTGNIKLSIDTSNNLYLDTFKISDILNNKKYRKQQVSANSVLSGDIRRVFKDMPLGELYRLDAEDTLDITLPRTDVFRQYDLNYSYGARLFLDDLYDDDYALVAPIWINNKLPDYFAIFRIDGVINQETYAGTSLDGLAEKFLEEGTLIKSWGIKDSTPLGTYLRSHLQELLEVRSPLFLSLSDPTQLDPDPNTWYGMAVDKGIITGRSETPYFFDQKTNFTDMNAFLSQGYERNNLLCPNLINMEYIFSDHDVSLYTMQRYYGLYMTENELYEISYYADSPDGSINILSRDGKDSNEFFDSSIFNADGSINDSYKNRMFTLDDLLEVKRITNVSQVNGTQKEYIEEWLNKPGDQLFTTAVQKKNINNFITIQIKNALSQGEHLRIIDKTDFKIWEAYAVDWDVLEAGQSLTYASTYEAEGYPIMYRTCFSILGDISDQINAIKSAFDVFVDYLNTPFVTVASTEDDLAFEITDWAGNHDMWFQRLTAQTVDNPLDPSSVFNAAAKDEDIVFYGVLEPTAADFERVGADSSYGPINFEIFGDRRSIMVDIFDSSSYNVYSFDASTVDAFEQYNMYMGQDGWYRIIYPFDVSTLVNHSFNYVTDPRAESSKYIILTEYPLQTVNGYWNGYATYPLIISLMGINPVKDIDFTVYDQSLGYESKYWYKREDDPSTYCLCVPDGSSRILDISNSYEIVGGDGSIFIGSAEGAFSSTSPINPFRFNTFDASAYITALGDVNITYAVLDGSKNYTSYVAGMSEERISSYYQDPSSLLKYGLTVPYVAKWQALGQDARNNPFRLMLDASLINPDVSSNYVSNFLTFEDPSGYIHYDGEMTYPSFKYLTPGEHAWKDYIFADVNDVVFDGSVYTTFRDLMLSESRIDVFSKFVYSNYNVDDTQLRSSIVYYNQYKQTVDTLLNGLSFSFSIDEQARNIIDIRDWDRFRISIVASPSRNRDSNKTFEVIINENTETILMIWYQGSDLLNYNKRYSSINPGKGVLDASTAWPFKSYTTGNKYRSHFKTPFFVNNSSLSSTIYNKYQYEFNYDSSVCTPYAQLNFNFGDLLNSVFNAYSYNYVSTLAFFFDAQYNTFAQYVDYDYFKNTSTFGSLVLNNSYSYMNNTNYYKDETISLDTLNEIINSNAISYYIWREDDLFTNGSFSVTPVIISINSPRSYKGLYTYNGWFTPSFNNILNFTANEENEIIDILKLDFTFSNTNFKSYEAIPQYWYNKVVTQVTSKDIAEGNAINYQENFNVFKSQWDNDYYIIDTSMGAQYYVEGYNSTLELPSYFGSKLVKLPESLALNEWDSTLTRVVEERNRRMFEFNLTRSIVKIFNNNATFTDNWSGITNAGNVIDGYIKKTILGYYNISKPKINVDMWVKPHAGENYIAYELTDEFKSNAAKNIDGNLYYVSGEYIYRVWVDRLPDLTYFFQFTLFEK